jgi:hypothetical protein
MMAEQLVTLGAFAALSSGRGAARRRRRGHEGPQFLNRKP